MRARGHISAMALAIAAAGVSLCFTFSVRQSMNVLGRRADNGRLQALWLARSAVTSGVTGASRLSTPAGEAAVKVTRGADETRALVEIPKVGRATILAKVDRNGQTNGWDERYEPSTPER